MNNLSICYKENKRLNKEVIIGRIIAYTILTLIMGSIIVLGIYLINTSVR